MFRWGCGGGLNPAGLVLVDQDAEAFKVIDEERQHLLCRSGFERRELLFDD